MGKLLGWLIWIAAAWRRDTMVVIVVGCSKVHLVRFIIIPYHHLGSIRLSMLKSGTRILQAVHFPSTFTSFFNVLLPKG